MIRFGDNGAGCGWLGKLDVVLLALILVVAAAYRFFGLDQMGLWGPELTNAGYVSGMGLLEMLRAAPYREIEPPGYISLLYVFAQCLGGSEFALRLISALAGAGSVCMVALLGRRCRLPAAGLIAATVLAAAPSAVTFSQEVQPYALLTCLVLLQLYLFMGLLDAAVPSTTQAPRDAGAGYLPMTTFTPMSFWIVTLLLLSVSYVAVFIVLMEVLLCAYWYYGRQQTSVMQVFRPPVLPCVMVLLLWLPALLVHVKHAYQRMTWQPLAASDTDQLAVFLLGYQPWWPWLVLAAVLVLVVLLAWRGLRRQGDAVVWPWVHLLVITGGFAVLVLAAKHMLPLIQFRMLLLVTQPLLFLLTAAGVVMLWERWAVPVVSAALTVFAMLFFFSVQADANVSAGLFRADRKPDLRPSIQMLLLDAPFMQGFRTLFVSAGQVDYYLKRYRIRPRDGMLLTAANPEAASTVRDYLNQSTFYYLDIIDSMEKSQTSPLLQALVERYGVTCYSATPAARLVKFDVQQKPAGVHDAPPCADRVDVLPIFPVVRQP